MLGAFKFGDIEVARTLLDLGTPVEFARRQRDRPRCSAKLVLNNEVEMASVAARSRGQRERVQDKLGMTPLLRAASSNFGDARMIDLLLASGAAADTRNKDGLTALELAPASTGVTTLVSRHRTSAGTIGTCPGGR